MENLTGGTPPVRYLLCVVPCKLYFKKMYDKNTAEEIKKNSEERKALEKACMDALPGESVFYELADRCFYSQPICVSGEIIYKDI